MIVSPDDCQVYEAKIPIIENGKPKAKEINYKDELIAYASLDMVELSEWQTNNMYLKQVDKFDDSIIHCFVTPGRMRFLLLHKGKSDDSIKNFFNDVYEYYVKALLNPFIDKNTKISSKTFDAKVNNLMKRHLN